MARKKKKVPEINASSTADIAFLLLIFFLITTSMDTDKGLARRLPPPVPKDQEKKDVEMNERNILVVLINSNNQLMVNGAPMQLNELRKKAIEFIKNENDDPNLPEREVVDVEFFGPMKVSKKHVISLQNDRGTEYQAYIEVQNELVAAYNEIRNEISKRKFGKTFDELDEAQRKAVATIYPQMISEAEPKNYGGKK